MVMENASEEGEYEQLKENNTEGNANTTSCLFIKLGIISKPFPDSRSTTLVRTINRYKKFKRMEWIEISDEGGNYGGLRDNDTEGKSLLNQDMTINARNEKTERTTTTEGYRNTQATKNNSKSTQRIKGIIKTKWKARNSKKNKTHIGK